ncbi:hypothetical protein [Oscillatoria acuminata]|nr:hypothetical protein [Oscillatoria acuminata]
MTACLFGCCSPISEGSDRLNVNNLLRLCSPWIQTGLCQQN